MGEDADQHAFNGPDALHRKLKGLAADSGQPLEDAGSRGHPGRTRVWVIVVDASALLELLLQTPLGTRVETYIYRDQDELHSPHLADVEVTQGLRKPVTVGRGVSGSRRRGPCDLTDIDFHRHAHLDLLPRAPRLRENVTSYDAMDIALAEALDATLVDL